MVFPEFREPQVVILLDDDMNSPSDRNISMRGRSEFKGYPIWLRLMARKVIRDYQVIAIHRVSGAEYVRLSWDNHPFNAWLERSHSRFDAKTLTGIVELEVRGSHPHIMNRLTKVDSGPLKLGQIGIEDASTDFCGLVMEILNFNLERERRVRASEFATSLSAIIDVGDIGMILLNASEVDISGLVIGDVLQGDGLPVIRPYPSVFPEANNITASNPLFSIPS